MLFCPAELEITPGLRKALVGGSASAVFDAVFSTMSGWRRTYNKLRLKTPRLFYAAFLTPDATEKSVASFMISGGLKCSG